MNILMLFMPTLFLSLSLSFAKENSKNKSEHVLSKIQYAGEGDDQLDNNSIFGSSDGFTPYGGLPNSYGGFIIPQEILRNRFQGSDGSSQDQDGGNQNEQSSGRSGYPYSGNSEGNVVPNGVFNPFLGGRRGISSTPAYGGNDGGTEPGYGGGSYQGGRYTPTYGLQPGIYSSSSGFRPGSGQRFYPYDRGYVYPLVGAGGIGVGLRQPNYPNGYGIGNGYGVYPGILRSVPTFYQPSPGGSGIYGGSPRGEGYGPALFGYGRYPEMMYPGLGFEYGRLNESSPRGDQPGGNVAPQGARFPYPQPTQSSVQPNETSEGRSKSLRREDP